MLIFAYIRANLGCWNRAASTIALPCRRGHNRSPGRSARAPDTTVEPRLAACIDVANVAATGDDSVPGTQHLLLGLLHAGLAAHVLDRLDVTRDKVRAVGARLFEPVVVTSPDGIGRRVVGDGEAGAAVGHARRVAVERGQQEVRGNPDVRNSAAAMAKSAFAASGVVKWKPIRP
jgi:hypothetical protein